MPVPRSRHRITAPATSAYRAGLGAVAQKRLVYYGVDASQQFFGGVAVREEELVDKVVARFADGRVLKGTTADFFPTKELFHLDVSMAPPGDQPLEIHTKDLKALFFVKDLIGDPEHVERKSFDPSSPPSGRRMIVKFKDGEVLVGTAKGYQPDGPGFFFVPADADSNNTRCYIVVAATEKIGFL